MYNGSNNFTLIKSIRCFFDITKLFLINNKFGKHYKNVSSQQSS